MRLINQNTLEEILLPDGLLWADEFNWNPVVSTGSYSLAGTLIIETGEMLDGRPITLEAPDHEMAWVTRATVRALRSAATAIPLNKFKLVFEYEGDTREFLVCFSPDSNPIEAKPVKGFPDHIDGAWFQVKLKFIEVK